MEPELDVSGFIIDTEQDVDESRYRIALRCRDAHKLNRDAEVECTISGSHNRRLTVKVNGVVYYRQKLPGEVTTCTHREKFGSKEDWVYVTVEKREPAMWQT